MLRLILILFLAVLNAGALIYTLLIWTPNPRIPSTYLAISTVVFSCLVVDLARDQLQTIAYYPITNLIFLLTFTLSCIAPILPVLSQYWSVVRLVAVTFYLLHEQYTIRQVVYRILQHDNTLKGALLILIGITSCTVLHVGIGTMTRLVVADGIGKSVHITHHNQQTDNINFNEDTELVQNNINDNRRMLLNQQQSSQLLHRLFTRFTELPQIIKALIILLPMILDLLSFIAELFMLEKPTHFHGHQHTKVYFSTDRTFFQDTNNQSSLSMSLFGLRIMSSAIIFHYLLKIWSQSLNNLTKQGIRDRFKLAMFGAMLAIGRMSSERL